MWGLFIVKSALYNSIMTMASRDRFGRILHNFTWPEVSRVFLNEIKPSKLWQAISDLLFTVFTSHPGIIHLHPQPKWRSVSSAPAAPPWVSFARTVHREPPGRPDGRGAGSGTAPRSARCGWSRPEWIKSISLRSICVYILYLICIYIYVCVYMYSYIFIHSFIYLFIIYLSIHFSCFVHT